MTAIFKIQIRSNCGYDAKGALDYANTMTVGQLREMLEGLDDDTLIVTDDLSNRRGANWGVVSDAYEDDIDSDAYEDDIDIDDDEDEE